MATNTAGGTTTSGKPDQLTVSLTVAKGGQGYGPIPETWTVAPARLTGTVYYNSYGTHLVQNWTAGTAPGTPWARPSSASARATPRRRSWSGRTAPRRHAASRPTTAAAACATSSRRAAVAAHPVRAGHARRWPELPLRSHAEQRAGLRRHHDPAGHLHLGGAPERRLVRPHQRLSLVDQPGRHQRERRQRHELLLAVRPDAHRRDARRGCPGPWPPGTPRTRRTTSLVSYWT